MAIQVRRGTFDKFDPSKLLPGEWAVVLSGDPNAKDGRSVYVCFAVGTTKRMATYEDMVEQMANAFEDFSQDFTASVTAATASASAAAGKADAAAGNASKATESAREATVAANTAAGNASIAGVEAHEAAQTADASTAAANALLEQLAAASGSYEAVVGYVEDLAEIGRLICGDGYVLGGYAYLDGLSVDAQGFLTIAGSEWWDDGYLVLDASGCGCEDAATAEDLAEANATITALQAEVAGLEASIAAIVSAAALDGFVLDGWMISNNVSASGGLLSLPTGTVSDGLMTIAASA